MVSQLLFGEAFEILTKSKDWTKVRTDMDSYVGWIQNGQFLAVTDDQYEEYQSLSKIKIGFDGGILSIMIFVSSFYMERLYERIFLILE